MIHVRMTSCPCCSHKSYEQCCGRFLESQQLPATPEELMRSRYTAYTQLNLDYIAKTMKSPAADDFDPASVRQSRHSLIWTGLIVLNASQTFTEGVVEFIASYTVNGKPAQLHERSRFRFESGRWYYVDAIV